MKNKILDQVHIIPFDIGTVFYDEVSLDNTKNIKLAELFTEEMSKFCKEREYAFTKNFESVIIGRRKKDYKFFSYAYARHCLFHVVLSKNLRFYMISSGVGVFVLNDIAAEYLPDDDLKNYETSGLSHILLARYQKEYMQEKLLEPDETSKLVTINNMMAEFKKKCWQTIEVLTKTLRINLLRPYSACDEYKHHGFSYVLSMYIANKKEVTEDELKYLLYASILKSNLHPSNWSKLAREGLGLMEHYECSMVKESERNSAYFSWSAVAIYTDIEYNIDELAEIDIFKDMLKAEIYVQTRWFVGDNTLDNVRGKYYNLEKIERLLGLLNLTTSELSNETSANMSTFYKKICKCIIETSSIQSLYSSASTQLNIQRNIKMAQYGKAKNKNRLILNLILSLFTAISLAKTLKDFLDSEFNWRNWIIFAATICIAVGVIVVNYYIDNRK